jgi:thiol peroxidase
MANTVTLGGNPIQVEGNFPQAGQQAPAFTLVGKDLADVSWPAWPASARSSTSSRASTRRPAPPRCASSTRAPAPAEHCRAVHLGRPALRPGPLLRRRRPGATCRRCRPCAAREFLEAYGVAIASGPLPALPPARSSSSTKDDKVLHSELVGEIKNEPDYDAALKALA